MWDDEVAIYLSQFPDSGAFLYGVNARFTCPDTDDFFYIRDENLAVTDTACLGRISYCFDHCICIFVSQNNLDLHLGQKVDDVFSTAIKFGMAFLATEAFCFSYSYSLKTDFLKGFLHFVELERLNDRFDLFHEKISLRFSR